MPGTWRSLSLQMISGLVAAVTPIAAVQAQGYAQTPTAPAYPPQGYEAPPPGYGQQQVPQGNYPPQQGYGQQGYGQPGQQGNYAPPPPPPMPQGYDGSAPPPPPPGYQNDPAYAASPEADRRYEAYAEDWAQRYCVKSGNNAGAGAVIGGLFGALLGSSVAGRGDHAGGAIIGGIAGAAGGAAIGSTSGNATSPGCPPGYVARREAPAFYYEGGDPYYYAAPDWYRPWIFVGGRWNYRPYPYHTYYYGRYYGPRGYYGRPGPRGYYGRGRRW